MQERKSNTYRQFTFCGFIAFVLLLLQGCQEHKVDPAKYLDTVINEGNVAQIIAIVGQKKPQLSKPQALFLLELKTITQGKDSYRKNFINAHQPRDQDDLVDSADFNRIRKAIFEDFEAKHVTLRKIFSELDKRQQLTESYRLKYLSLYKKVDSYNLAQQKKIEFLALNRRKIQNEVKKKVSIEVARIIPRQGVYLMLFKFTNHMKTPINELDFELTLKDKHGQKITTFKSGISNFSITDTQTLTMPYSYQSKWQADQFWDLEKADLSGHLSSDYVITKLKSLGKTWPDYGKYTDIEHLKNQHYHSPEKLTGKGPYTSDVLKARVNKVEKEVQQKIQAQTPIITHYRKFTYRFIDMDKLVQRLRHY
ncbi:hypothetical protein [Celerinatantimonas sp. MCCC 1A17872]|uniref:hypothetical protein n=1 Tax=Celerinatantimonas sp. MCCC 1A17872 TaxID=3177514 RepID=UPI0038C05764